MPHVTAHTKVKLTHRRCGKVPRIVRVFFWDYTLRDVNVRKPLYFFTYQ
jgi:hypothetical protein